ncbi:NAD-dependent epimerase/dehydratase family protein [Candidatus Bipolaricaulota bacterium]|nr:NAD-dependent epimerase/dehydratase family protein [Candidatus Bipolaricaulota bacterium]
MRIVITGGAGFIGSHLADACLAEGHDVLIVDDLSHGKREHIPDAARFERVDVRDQGGVRRIFASFRPQIVSHQAAQADLRVSLEDPRADAEINLLGAVVVLEEAARANACAVILASSGGAIYGETPLPATETAPKAPLSPYGAAKIATEQYLYSYVATGRLAGCALRYGNVYGPRQDPSGEAGVVAIFSGRLARQETCTIFGDGGQLRDFTHVSDVVRAHAAAIDWVCSPQSAPASVDDLAFNVATGCSTSILELYTTMAQARSVELPPAMAPARHGELYESRLDPTKSRAHLGCSASVALRDGVLTVLDWVEAHGADGA